MTLRASHDPVLRMKSLVNACRPHMAAIEKAFDRYDALVVDLYEEAKAIARANNMLTREKVHSKYMYVGTGDRYEDGIVPTEMTDLISNITNNGFRHHHLQRTTCAGCPRQTLQRSLQLKPPTIRW